MPLTLTATPLSTTGEDRPLLLLGPSLGTTAERLWAPVVPFLQDVAHLVAWDLPGHGASPRAFEGFTVSDLADAVTRLAQSWGEETGATSRHHAGVSLGGAVTLEIGIRHPGAFDGLAVVCSGPKLGTPESWNDRATLIRDQGTEAVIVGSRERWFAPGFVESHPEVANGLLDGLPGIDDESYARCCEALASYDAHDRLSDITDPIVAIAGVHDVVAPPSMAEEIASSVRQGRSVALDGVAHQAPSEDPEATARVLRDLLTPTTEETR